MNAITEKSKNVRKGRRSVRKEGPHPIDAYVGTRVRMRRTLMGMTQEGLAEKIGLTFQQIQKYERGMNRISASMLYVIAEALDVPFGFFVDGYSEDPSRPHVSLELSHEEITVLRGMKNMDANSRAALVKLTRALGNISEESE